MAHNALISKDIVNNLQSNSPKGNSLFFRLSKSYLTHQIFFMI